MKILDITSIDIKLNQIENMEQDFDSMPELELDTNNNENYERGFIGNAFIYDEQIYINTYTGEGYDAVIKKMKNYVDWYSGKIRLSGFEREDIKQLICLIIFDGIRRYNPNLNIKLSTFLYVHIKNRIISRIKEETRQSSNATYIEPLYKFICPCGFNITTNKQEATVLNCNICHSKIGDSWSVRAEHNNPISLDSIISTNYDDENNNDRDSQIFYNGKQTGIIDFFGKVVSTEDLEKNSDLMSILENEDEITQKIAKLMYYNDYSITDAAKEVGLTCWAASLRLKKLKHKKNIKEYFLFDKI